MSELSDVYKTAVYAKIDSIRFEVFMRSFTSLLNGMTSYGDFTPLGSQMNKETSATVLVDATEALMQAALDKMEGLEIIHRRGAEHPPGSIVLTCNECNGQPSPEIIHTSSCSYNKAKGECPVCSGTGELY